MSLADSIRSASKSQIRLENAIHRNQLMDDFILKVKVVFAILVVLNIISIAIWVFGDGKPSPVGAYQAEGCPIIYSQGVYNQGAYNQGAIPEGYVEVYRTATSMVVCPRDTANAIRFRVEHPERFNHEVEDDVR